MSVPFSIVALHRKGPYIGRVPARAVDRSSPMPLWAQVLDDLRRRLGTGEFESGLPAERELIAQYATSRHTMREAMRRLHDDGLIDRERGRGTFVRRRAISQTTGSLYSLFRSVEAQGFAQRSTVLAQERRRDPAVAAQMGLRATTPFVYLHRLRSADGEPFAVDEVWLVHRVAAPLLDADFAHSGVYAELEQRCGVHAGSGWERIRPALPSPDERRLLRLPARQAVFVVERATTVSGAPLEWRRTIVRGDRYSFLSTWDGVGQPTQPPTFAPAAPG